MPAADTAARLERFSGRGAGTDAERRAARWLAAELARTGREVVLEPFWCRPNWALAHAWHIGLALAGSLVSVSSPRVGGALLLAALVCVVLDTITGRSPGRRLTPEHASQNVVGLPPARPGSAERVTLIVVANYDAARTGLAYHDRLRRPAARLKRTLRGLTPGWLGWLVLAIVWLLVIAIIRLEGDHGRIIGVVQFPPTLGLVLGLALLLELATGEFSPSAGDNGSGVGVALALARALDVSPPANLDIELVLVGAGDGEATGMRSYLRERRGELGPGNTVVLEIAACADGHPRWWQSGGALLPLRFFGRLRAVSREIGAQEPALHASPHSSRSNTPALIARQRGLPAIAIGCLDNAGLCPRSHQQRDTSAALDQEAADEALQFALQLADAIDREVARTRALRAATPA